MRQHRAKKQIVTHIVLHSTGTHPDTLVDTTQQPFHFAVTQAGKLVNIRQVDTATSEISIAWIGGLDNEGNHVDNRTEPQKETLFNTLVLLSEYFPEATIIGADELNAYDFPNPGFNIKEWLRSYIPAFLDAA